MLAKSAAGPPFEEDEINEGETAADEEVTPFSLAGVGDAERSTDARAVVDVVVVDDDAARDVGDEGAEFAFTSTNV